MGFKKQFKESIFNRTFLTIKQKPLNYFYTLMIDALFLISLIVINLLLGRDIPAADNLSINYIIKTLSLFLFQLILIIYIYSVSKFYVFNFIKKYFKEAGFKFKKSLSFLFLNISLGIVFVLALFLTGLLINAVVIGDYTSKIGSVILILYSIIFYFIMNLAHILFFKGSSLKKSFYHCFSLFFKKIKYFLPVIGFSLLLFLAFDIVYLAFYRLFEGQFFYSFIRLLTVFYAYLIIAFNRIYLYNIITNKIK